MPEAGVVIAQCVTFPTTSTTATSSLLVSCGVLLMCFWPFLFLRCFFWEQEIDRFRKKRASGKWGCFSLKTSWAEYDQFSDTFHITFIIFNKDLLGVHNFLKIQQILIHMKENSLKHHETSWKWIYDYNYKASLKHFLTTPMPIWYPPRI